LEKQRQLRLGLFQHWQRTWKLDSQLHPSDAVDNFQTGFGIRNNLFECFH
jgi:hypothetical protein